LRPWIVGRPRHVREKAQRNGRQKFFEVDS
jgi:hypothetical protein